MKLHTAILPRRDNTVRVVGEDKKTYVFAEDDTGTLVCDIEHDATLTKLLLINDGSSFFPADAADYQKASELITPAGGGVDDDDLDDDDGDPNGMLLETGKFANVQLPPPPEDNPATFPPALGGADADDELDGEQYPVSADPVIAPADVPDVGLTPAGGDFPPALGGDDEMPVVTTASAPVAKPEAAPTSRRRRQAA